MAPALTTGPVLLQGSDYVPEHLPVALVEVHQGAVCINQGALQGLPVAVLQWYLLRCTCLHAGIFDNVEDFVQGHAGQYGINVSTVRHDGDSAGIECLHPFCDTGEQAKIGAVNAVGFCEVEIPSRKLSMEGLRV